MDVVEATALIAPEVDRLVFAIGRAIPDSERSKLHAEAKEFGLDSLGVLPNFADFLLETGITPELAEERRPYAPPDEVVGWINLLEAAEIVQQVSSGWVRSTARARPFLERLDTTPYRAARALWGPFEDQVDAVSAAARQVIANTSVDHRVAVEHRQLTVPRDQCAAMLHRLLTLRYIRQHDHAAAWKGRGLTAPEMVVMTELWHGGVVDESDALASLIDKGFATPDQTLTADGQEVRDRIETETNRRNAEDFAVLGPAGCEEFLANLRTLPPT